MGSDGMSKQIARWIALGALFLIPITPLIVADSYFFPFITGKAFYFRILVEIAFSAWVVLALIDREYRPRFSWIGAITIAFVSWMFIADAFAPNAAKAFWSNFERMEGWVLLIHLLGFFYVAGAVLRAERKWRAWFLTSLGVSLIISGYALLQLNGSLAIHQGSTRIDATLGNSAYLAIYFLFNVFIALWLALTEKYGWLKWLLISLAVVEAILIFFTETRGAVLGLVGALGLAALLAVLTGGKNTRRFAAFGLAFIILASSAFYAARDSAFVQNNHVLQRVASISLADGETRFTIWGMAFNGALERPITGWGQEGFNYVFNKYYEPSLYAQEPWFDRAHNAFIDWLTAGGFPAFLLYISLFVMAVISLWKSSELSRAERIALTAALAGYAVHNLFVFDNLYSYVYFFAVLALIDSQVGRPIERIERAPELNAADSAVYALPIIVVVASVLVWTINISGMQAAKKLIVALSPSPSGIKANIAVFEDLAAHLSFASQEIREQLVSFAASVVRSTQATDEEKRKAVSLAIEEMRKQVAEYPNDARERLQLSYAYRFAGDTASAFEEIQSAINLSPRRQNFLIEAGSAAWEAGDFKLARDAFNKAYELSPQFTELAAYSAAGEITAGFPEESDRILQNAYGTTTVDSNILAAAYYQAKAWPRLVAMMKLRVNKQGAGFDVWLSLAAVYYAAGDKRNAVNTINAATALFPESAQTGAAVIKQIEEDAVGK